MTAAEAAAARAACLAACDERAAARRALLQARLAEHGAEVGHLDEALAAEATVAPADAERLRAERAAAAFRLRVAQRRFEEHGPRAAAARADLKARLAADRRLAAALAGNS